MRNQRQKILLTGATGFVGAALVKQLLQDNYQVSALVRNPSSKLPHDVRRILFKDYENSFLSLNTEDDFKHRMKNGMAAEYGSEVFEDIDVIVHLAARAHIMKDELSDPLAEYKKINTNTTLYLARLASNAGVKRFIFLSSIKVNGEATIDNISFTEQDSCHPSDPYGVSKWEAEQGLRKLAIETGMEVVIIRPPLVYGPSVKGNFLSMMNWINKGIPLPFGSTENQRSLLALDNLISFIILCLDHPRAANETFLLADEEDVSTKELIIKLAKAMDKKSRLLPIPPSLMRKMAGLIGKSDLADRLLGSLQVDSSKARDYLGWKPVISMDEQLKKMVN